MQNFRSYIDTKKELELTKLNIATINKKITYLSKEKTELETLASDLDATLNKIEEHLKDMRGIEKELMYEILVKGKNVTRAVEIVAFTNNLDSSTIWKGYYPKVKENLQSLE